MNKLTTKKGLKEIIESKNVIETYIYGSVAKKIYENKIKIAKIEDLENLIKTDLDLCYIYSTSSNTGAHARNEAKNLHQDLLARFSAFHKIHVVYYRDFVFESERRLNFSLANHIFSNCYLLKL